MKLLVKILRILCICFIVIFIVAITIRVTYQSSVKNVTNRIMKENEGIKKVEVLSDHGIVDLELTLEITFYDGRRVVLERVDGKQKGDIRIASIGSNDLWTYERVNNKVLPGDFLELSIFAQELKIPLETVGDVIKNYKVIDEYVENLENIDEEKYKKWRTTAEFRKWIWTSEAGLNIIETGDNSYVLFKLPKYEKNEDDS